MYKFSNMHNDEKALQTQIAVLSSLSTFIGKMKLFVGGVTQKTYTYHDPVTGKSVQVDRFDFGGMTPGINIVAAVDPNNPYDMGTRILLGVYSRGDEHLDHDPVVLVPEENHIKGISFTNPDDIVELINYGESIHGGVGQYAIPEWDDAQNETGGVQLINPQGRCTLTMSIDGGDAKIWHEVDYK